MTLDQLRIFVAVAEQQHVTRAAAEVGLSQSAVSNAIGALESQYRVRFFDRIGRGIVLTPTGRAFLEEARAVLTRAATAHTVLSDLAGLRCGSLHLAASQTVANYWLPGMMQRFRKRYPGVKLKLSITNTAHVVQQVGDGLVDLGFVEDEIDATGFDVHPVAQDELVLMVSAKHFWASRGALPSPETLNESPWVIRERGSGTRMIFEKTVRQLGVDPASLEVALELPSNEAIRQAVEAGAGAAVVSRLVAMPAVAAGTIVIFEWPMPTRAFLMLGRQKRYATEAMRTFIKLASDNI